MILSGINNKSLHVEVTKEHIALIFKEEILKISTIGVLLILLRVAHLEL